MKETRFIAQNKEKWQESEKLLGEPVKDPEKLSNLFTQVVDDLSFSRTYYPNRSVRIYLNKMAREYFNIIYSHHRHKKNAFREFWLNELPQIVYYSRKPLTLSLLIFLLSMSIGIFSAVKDPQFTSSILGQAYVDMTKENIEHGDPMAVYKKGHQVDMFLGITLNNLMVAFRTYVFGVFLSIGTVAILLYNGIMVGCFQYFFIERNLFAESALTIWLHGTLEISSIILAGGAGLTLGSGLIFPGTYSRLQAFQISAMRSLKLMLGITPVFVFAAIIESFLTRYTEIPDLLRLLLILLSAGFIIGYFVVYPWMKAAKGFDQPLHETRLQPFAAEPVFFDRIKNNAEMIRDAFTIYRKYANRILPLIAGVTFLMTLAEFFAPVSRSSERIYYEDQWWLSFFNDLYYAVKTPVPYFILVNSLGCAMICYRVFTLVHNEFQKMDHPAIQWKIFFSTVFFISPCYLIVCYLEGWGILVLIVTYLVCMITAFACIAKSSSIFSAISTSWRLITSGFSQVTGLQMILLLMTFSFLLLLSAPLLYLNTTILEWNFAESDVWSKNVVDFIVRFIKLFAFNLILPILAVSAASFYFSSMEMVTAANLKNAISMIGSQAKKYRK